MEHLEDRCLLASVQGTVFNDLDGDKHRDVQFFVGDEPDIVFVMDVSGSTSGSFTGSSVGDLNGDGQEDTVLDAEIAALAVLNQDLIDHGFGSVAEIGIVAFNDSARQIDMNPATAAVELTARPETDVDQDGILDVIERVSELRSGGNTNFQKALQEAAATLTSLGTFAEHGNVIFLTDGIPGEGDMGAALADEVSLVRSRADNVRAFGVSTTTDPADIRDNLQVIDPNAIVFQSTDELLNAFNRLGQPGSTQFLEPGVPGVIVYADVQGDGERDTVDPFTTSLADDPSTPDIDESGLYTLDGLSGRTYTIRHEAPDLHVESFPGPPDFGHRLDLGPNDTVEGIDFGHRLANTVQGYVWDDRNGDGDRDSGEPRLENWRVFLDADGDGTLDNGETETRTDGNGRYTLTQLADGTHTITVKLMSDWRRTFPPATVAHMVTLIDGQLVTDVNFGVTQHGAIRGVKWNDINGDGTWSPNGANGIPGDADDEVGIRGWTIYIDTNNNLRLDPAEPSRQTNRNGIYSFDGLPIGTYTLREEADPNWQQTFPAASGSHIVSVGIAQVIEDVDFGNVRLAEIRGHKWDDVNGDGVMNPGESPLSGWKVYLDQNRNGELDAGEMNTITRADGSYEFTGLAPGDYTVAEEVRPAWTQTFPGPGYLSVGPNVNVTQTFNGQSEVSIAINPSNPMNLIVAPIDAAGLLGMPSRDVVWTTYDAGATWTPTVVPIPASAVASRGDPTIVFDRTGRAVYGHLVHAVAGGGPTHLASAVSTDGGTTWSAHDITVPSAMAYNDDKLFLAAGPDATDVTRDRFYVTWNQLDANIYVSSSSDGMTWSAPVQVSDNAAANDPIPAVGPLGELTICWEDYSTAGVGRLECDTSVDGGVTWGADVLAYTSDLNYATDAFGGGLGLDGIDEGTVGDGFGDYEIPAQHRRAIWMGLSIAVDKSNGPFRGRTYVAFADQGDQDGNPDSANAVDHHNTDIFLIASDDHGATWNALGANPVRVNDDTGTNSQFFSWLDVDPATGLVAVGWYDARNDVATGDAGDTDNSGMPNDEVQLFVSASRDGGQTFWRNVAASQGVSNSALASSFEFGDYIGLAFRDGTFYPAWADNSNSTGDNPDGSARMDTYTVEVTVRDGHTRTLQYGQVADTVDFGNRRRPGIHGVVWNDLDGDGTHDADEPGLDGWRVFLDLNNNRQLDPPIEQPVLTAADGSYAFASLPSGTYYVALVAEDGWQQTSPPNSANHTVTLASGQTLTDIDFGVFESVEIRGTKWNDENGNRQMDPNESPLEGWTIMLYEGHQGGQGAPLETTTTRADGSYEFTGLVGGRFTVAEMHDDEWRQSVPNGDYHLTLSPGQSASGIDFGNYRPHTIRGRKWNDINGDGFNTFDDEPGLSDWTIFLDENGDLIFQPWERFTTTDADGRYEFSDLPTGQYTVMEVWQPGWHQSSPREVCTREPQPQLVNFDIHDDLSEFDFGNFLSAEIHGVKFNDLDGDGVQDVNEPGLPDWIVYIDENLNGRRDNCERFAVTDASGAYDLTDLPRGSFTVVEESQPGWVQTFPPGMGVHDIELGAGHIAYQVNFGNRIVPGIRGQKWNDLNANGVREDSERSVEGWTIYLRDENSGQILRSTLTDAAGYFAFEGLAPGTYVLSEEQRAGWQVTFPTLGMHTVTLSPGSENDYNFGNYQPSQIRGVVFNDRNGNSSQDVLDVGLPTMTVFLDADRDGVFDERDGDVETATDADGRYVFTDLKPGTYYVDILLPEHRRQTLPTDPDTYSVTLGPGEIADDRDFGIQELAEIRGMVFDDRNGNGVREMDEPGIPGRTVFVDLDLDSHFDDGTESELGTAEPSAVTDSDGNYQLMNIVPGIVTVAHAAVDGWWTTAPNSLGEISFIGSHTFAIAAGQLTEPWDFGSQQLASVRGTVFGDVNGNSLPISGWTIYSDVNRNGQLDANDISVVSNDLGQFELANLLPGAHHVAASRRSGWEQTSPSPERFHAVSLTAGQVVMGVDFHNRQLIGIHGSVWNDADMDGVRMNEAGLPDWTVFLDDDGDGELDDAELSTSTDILGHFAFLGLPPGNYTLAQELPSGWEQTFPADSPTHAVTVMSGQVADGYHFGNSQPGKIRGTVYHDWDGNGQRNAGEPGLASWRVFLDEDNDQELDTGETSTSTNNDGEFEFSGLASAFIYALVTESRAGWRQTFPADSRTHRVIVNPGGTSDGNEFGIQQLATVRGTKWHDLDRNAVRDTGEPGLAGWTVFVDADLDGILDDGENRAVTDENGDYLLNDLLPGKLVIHQLEAPGWLQTFPPAPGYHIVVAEFGQQISTVDFGGFRQGQIGGTSFDDSNGNGLREPDEPGLSGWTIYADLNHNDQFDIGEPSDITRDDGKYTIRGLGPGTYAVAESPQLGWSQTFPRASQPHVIDLAAGESITSIDFGNQQRNAFGIRIDPLPNSHVAPTDTRLSIEFNQIVDPSLISADSIVAHASQTGSKLIPSSTFAINNTILTFIPNQGLKPGDLVQASTNLQVLNSLGEGTQPFVWQFRVGVPFGKSRFDDSSRTPSSSVVRHVALGDLDNDGDLDAVAVDRNDPRDYAEIWFFDGSRHSGRLVDTGQRLRGGINSAELGDFDSDGDLDIFLSSDDANMIWLNDGLGNFTDSGQELGSDNWSTEDAAVGDLDGDGDLDIVSVEGSHAVLYLNDGQAKFAWSHLAAAGAKRAVNLADLDNDGDLDLVLFVNNNNVLIRFNDGKANFVAGSSFQADGPYGLSLGDVDGDADVDAVVAGNGGMEVWLNDGFGAFAHHESLGGALGAVELGDLNGDGNLDAVTIDNEGLTIWHNAGDSEFIRGQRFEPSQSGTVLDVALGDIDNNGTLDAMTVGGARAQILFNLYGDVSGNNRLDARDINELAAAIRQGTADQLYDLNKDGMVDKEDHVFLIEHIFQTRMGDSDLDGNVDGADFSALQGSLFQGGTNWQRGDFNGDGSTDGSDFNLWNENKFLINAPSAAASMGRRPRMPLPPAKAMQEDHVLNVRGRPVVPIHFESSYSPAEVGSTKRARETASHVLRGSDMNVTKDDHVETNPVSEASLTPHAPILRWNLCRARFAHVSPLDRTRGDVQFIDLEKLDRVFALPVW